MDVSDLRGKTALVTGAASGIGRATALAFARRGARLIVSDLNEEGLSKTADSIRKLGSDVVTHRVDVADRNAMQAFAETVHRDTEAVDILMNNAGVAISGGFIHTTLQDWDWILGINLMGVIYGCHFFIPKMIARGRGGHVVNVSSAAGYTASEALAAYSTTKFAVFGLSEALRDELERYGIGVTTICPGFINTPITSSARLRGPDATPEAQQRMIAVYQRRNYTPERVAENILKAVQRNRRVAPISLEAWILYYLKRLSPGLLARVGRFIADRATGRVPT